MRLIRPAIPTIYRGIHFRSRLEATWAAFFDELSWRWEYEPLDLNGYIPDFVLMFPNDPLLVEVKPELRLDDLAQHAPRIERSGWEKEALIVGASVSLLDNEENWDDRTAFGLLAERMCESELETPDWAWDAGVLAHCTECGFYSIYHSVQSYCCRYSGCYDGGNCVDRLTDGKRHQLWARAKNRTQWQPQTPRWESEP